MPPSTIIILSLALPYERLGVGLGMRLLHCYNQLVLHLMETPPSSCFLSVGRYVCCYYIRYINKGTTKAQIKTEPHEAQIATCM